MKMDPNNFGQLIGRISDVYDIELKDGYCTKLEVEIDGAYGLYYSTLSIYNCDYKDKLWIGRPVQVMYSLRDRKAKKGKYPFLEACVSTVVFMPNEYMTSTRTHKKKEEAEGSAQENIEEAGETA